VFHVLPDLGAPVARTIALAAMALLLARPVSAGQARQPFSGRVIDEKTSAAVAGAVVTIGGVPGSVKTDADGRFTFEPGPTPPFQVIVVLAAVRLPDRCSPPTDTPATVSVHPLADESVTSSGPRRASMPRPAPRRRCSPISRSSGARPKT
jgi:hypothetical protein